MEAVVEANLKPAYENRLNILLSELLGQLGIISHSEILGKGRRDVVVYHQGLTIVLEGSYSKDDAEKDARKRIEQLNADVALAVHYVSKISQDTSEYEIKKWLMGVKFSVKVILPEDISGTFFEIWLKKKVVAKPLEEWHEVDLNSLASLIKEIGQYIISEESVEHTHKEVAELIQRYVSYLSSVKNSTSIVGNLYDILYRLYGFSIGDPNAIKEAVFAQAVLAILLSAIYYESIRYAHKLHSLHALAAKGNPQDALEKATHNILAINYEPIFEATGEMLKVFPPMSRLFDMLIDLAVKIASKKSLLRKDLAGKVYHKVV